MGPDATSTDTAINPSPSYTHSIKFDTVEFHQAAKNHYEKTYERLQRQSKIRKSKIILCLRLKRPIKKEPVLVVLRQEPVKSILRK